VRMGAVMMTLSPARARARDVAFIVGQRLPGFRRFFREMRFKPPATYADGVFLGNDADSPVGSMLVQPWVLDHDGTRVRLDERTGPGFTLLGIDTPPAALADLSADLWGRLDATRVRVVLDDRLARPSPLVVTVADADGLLAEQLGDLRGQVVLVRPDRFIAGAFRPAAEHAFAAAFARGLGAPSVPAAAPLEAA